MKEFFLYLGTIDPPEPSKVQGGMKKDGFCPFEFSLFWFEDGISDDNLRSNLKSVMKINQENINITRDRQLTRNIHNSCAI